MEAMTVMLVSVVEQKNILYVLAVLICCCTAVIFMWNMMRYRQRGEDMMDGLSVHQVQHQTPKKNIERIPFRLKLTETSHCSLPDSNEFRLNDLSEVQCMVSSHVPFTLQVLWGVSIRELHLLLSRPWSALQSQVQAGNLLEGHYQWKGIIIQKASHNNEVIKMSLPQPPLDLVTLPRMYYPLVIFLVRTEPVQPDETVSLIYVVHIKDTVCPLPTSILAQYLKQANGQISCLQEFYRATGNPPSYDDESDSSMSCQPDEEEHSVWTTSSEDF